MKEINNLTQRLLAEGFTEYRYPDYVKEYNWFYGGFVYKQEAKREMTFKTPCGLFCTFESVLEGLSYDGFDWSIEYDRAICFCPYCTRTNKCMQNDKTLEKLSAGAHYEDMHYCRLECTEEQYDYENSVEKQEALNEQIKKQKLSELKERTKGHICYFQIHYNRSKQKYWQSYCCTTCIVNNCDYCTLRQRQISGKKAHIVYDIKTMSVVKGIGMIPDEIVESVSRNHKFTRKPIYEDLAAIILKQAEKEINQKLRSEYHSSLFDGTTKSVQAINVRVEKKLKHDIYEDLALIAEGIKVSYADVLEKQAKAQRSKRKSTAKKKKLDKLLKRYAQFGYDGLGNLRYQFDKMVDKGEIDIDEADNERRKYLEKRQEEKDYNQLSFFDQ